MPKKKPEHAEPGTTTSHHHRRRKLLKSALLGGGAAATSLYAAPESWIRPVIRTVVLPAHAQMSPATLAEGPWAGGAEGITQRAPLGTGNLAGRIADFFLPPANAQQLQCGVSFQICIEPTDSDDEVEIKIGFNRIPFGSATVTLSSDLTFSETIDEWLVEGAYESDIDRWRGNVSGPCPRVRRATNAGIFTGERIQVASASDQLQFFAQIEPEGLDREWRAAPHERCAVGMQPL